MKKISITQQVYNRALDILEKNPDGVRWTDLNKMIEKSDKKLHPKTINGCVWRLIEKYPDKVYKPEKGLFRLLKYKSKK